MIGGKDGTKESKRTVRRHEGAGAWDYAAEWFVIAN